MSVLGCNLSSLVFSRPSKRKRRIAAYCSAKKRSRGELRTTPEVPVVIHGFYGCSRNASPDTRGHYHVTSRIDRGQYRRLPTIAHTDFP